MIATTVDRALDVLFRLLSEPSPVGVTELGRALGLPKANIHRLLTSLRRRDLVERDERGRYRPGFGLVALGLGVLEREPIVAVAHPVLEAEAGALGETTFLVGARAGGLVVLDKVEGDGFLRAAPRVGAQVPVHATAAGQLFLAGAPELVELPPGSLERFTEQSPRSRPELERQSREAFERGWAHNRDAWIEGLSVVAAPIVTRGRLRAALAVAATTPRMTSLGPEAVAERAMAASRRVAGRLEGNPS